LNILKERYSQCNGETVKSAKDRFIDELKTMTPEELVYGYSSQKGTLSNDLKALNEIKKYNLPDEVTNMLIRNTMFVCDYNLSIRFMEKLAEDWLGRRIKTAEEAFEISNKEFEKYKEWAANVDKAIENENQNVNGVELTILSAIKTASNIVEISDKDLGKFVRELLKS